MAQDVAETIEEPNPVDDDELRIDGPWRRNAPLLITVGLSILLSPLLTQLLKSYRGIAIELNEQKALVAFEKAIPRWLSVPQGTALGDVLVKRSGRWSPERKQRQESDRGLIELYERYQRSYRAEIIEIRPPVAPRAPSVAVVQTESGERFEMEIWAQHLAEAAVGKWLLKKPNAWDPVLEHLEPASP